MLCFYPSARATSLPVELVDGGPHELSAAVLRPGGLIAAGNSGVFLAVADGHNAVAGDADLGKVLADSLGAAFAEGQVVFLGAALVAVAGDLDDHVRHFVDALGVGLKDAKLVTMMDRQRTVRNSLNGLDLWACMVLSYPYSG